MSANAVMGHQGRWAIVVSNAAASTTTIDGSTLTYPVISDSLTLKETIGHQKGIRGHRYEQSEGTRVTGHDISGTMVVELSPKWLDIIIPLITGDPTTPFTMKNTLGNGIDICRYDGITGKARLYRNVQCASLTINFNGDFVTASMNLVGLNETETSFLGAALATTADWQPYLPSELTFNAGSTPADRNIESATLTIDNGLQARRRMKLAPQCYLPGMRTITLNTDAEWGSASELELFGDAGVGYAATLTLTHGGGAMSSVLSLTKLQIPSRPPGISGPDEIIYPIQGVIRGTGATTEISWTNDSTL